MAENDSWPGSETAGPGDQGQTSSSMRISGGSFSGNIAMGNVGPVSQFSQAAEPGRLAEIEDLLSQLETGLRGMGGGCQSPVGAYAQIEGDKISLKAVSFREEMVKRMESKRPISEAALLGEQIAVELK